MSTEEFRNSELTDLEAQIESARRSTFHKEKESWLSGKSRISFVVWYAIATVAIIALGTSIVKLAELRNVPVSYKFNGGFYVDSRGVKHELVGEKYEGFDKATIVANVKEIAYTIEKDPQTFKQLFYEPIEWESSNDGDFLEKRDIWYNTYLPTAGNSPVTFTAQTNPVDAFQGQSIKNMVLTNLDIQEAQLPDWMKDRPDPTDPNPLNENLLTGNVDYLTNNFYTIKNNYNKLMQLNFKEHFDKPVGNINSFACIEGEVDRNTNAWRSYVEFIKGIGYDKMYMEKDWIPKCTKADGKLVDIDSLFDYCVNPNALFIVELAGNGSFCGTGIKRPEWTDVNKWPGMTAADYEQSSIIMTQLNFNIPQRLTEPTMFHFRHPPRNTYAHNPTEPYIYYQNDFIAWVEKQTPKTEIQWNRQVWANLSEAEAGLRSYLERNISDAFLTKIE